MQERDGVLWIAKPPVMREGDRKEFGLGTTVQNGTKVTEDEELKKAQDVAAAELDRFSQSLAREQPYAHMTPLAKADDPQEIADSSGGHLQETEGRAFGINTFSKSLGKVLLQQKIAQQKQDEEDMNDAELQAAVRIQRQEAAKDPEESLRKGGVALQTLMVERVAKLDALLIELSSTAFVDKFADGLERRVSSSSTKWQIM